MKPIGSKDSLIQKSPCCIHCMHNFSDFKYQLTELDHFKIEMKAHEYNLSQKYYEIDRNIKQIMF